jgi:hypothetical protein
VAFQAERTLPHPLPHAKNRRAGGEEIFFGAFYPGRCPGLSSFAPMVLYNGVLRARAGKPIINLKFKNEGRVGCARTAVTDTPLQYAATPAQGIGARRGVPAFRMEFDKYG